MKHKTSVEPVDSKALSHSDETMFSIEWGISRHELIAGAAEQLLTPTALAVAKQIMKPINEQSLSSLAGWADQIKRRQAQPGDDVDTVAFLNDERNKGQASWHFVDIPVGADEYSRQRYPDFTNNEDVVQMIQASVSVLMKNSDRFSRLNALRLVVHLVGDVHQPLHVGCCYIGLKNGKDSLVQDPVKAKNLPSDRGGNNIILPTGGTGTSMHSFWDSSLPGTINARPANTRVIAEAVNKRQKEESIQKLLTMIQRTHLTNPTVEAEEVMVTLSPDQWAIGWATQSLLKAREAYKGLAISQKTGQKFKVTWEGKSSYVARCTPIVSERLTAAATNLAKLLNAVLS